MNHLRTLIALGLLVCALGLVAGASADESGGEDGVVIVTTSPGK